MTAPHRPDPATATVTADPAGGLAVEVLCAECGVALYRRLTAGDLEPK